jgi:hypothetical protein
MKVPGLTSALTAYANCKSSAAVATSMWQLARGVLPTRHFSKVATAGFCHHLPAHAAALPALKLKLGRELYLVTVAKPMRIEEHGTGAKKAGMT